MTDAKQQDLVRLDVQGTQLERYGQREVVKELVSRLMAFHPAAAEVGEQGMLAAAQLAVLIGASPLPGLNEIHIWKDRKDGTIHVQPGVNYDRRRAGECGGVFWILEPLPMSMDDRRRFGIADNVPAALCRAARQDKVRELLASGIPFEAALKALAQTGIGVAAPTDYAKAGRPLVWSAMKRAEADLYRKLFPNLERPASAEAVVQEALRNLDSPQIIPASDIVEGEWNEQLFGYGETGEVVGQSTCKAIAQEPVTDPVGEIGPRLVGPPETQDKPAPTNGNDAPPVAAGLNADLESLDWRQFHETVVKELHTGAVQQNTAILNKVYGPVGWSKKSKTDLWATIAKHMSEKQEAA